MSAEPPAVSPSSSSSSPASRRTSLLVLGSRGQGLLASGLFGSVSRGVIRRNGCPVVIARTRPSVVALPH